LQHSSIGRLQQEDDLFGPEHSPSNGVTNNGANGAPDGKDVGGHLQTKIVVDPPNLDEWRQKLFDVNEMIILSEDQYAVICADIQCSSSKLI